MYSTVIYNITRSSLLQSTFVQLPFKSTIKSLTLRVISKQKGALWVSVDGKKIKRYLVKSQWEKAEEGWYYNLSDRTILINTAVPKKDNFDIIVSTEEFDLIGMNKD